MIREPNNRTASLLSLIRGHRVGLAPVVAGVSEEVGARIDGWVDRAWIKVLGRDGRGGSSVRRWSGRGNGRCDEREQGSLPRKACTVPAAPSQDKRAGRGAVPKKSNAVSIRKWSFVVSMKGEEAMTQFEER